MVTKTVHTGEGPRYAVKMEYFQTIRSAEARLIWSLPGGQTQEAVDAAAKADLVVVVLGLSQRIEGEEMKVNAEGFASGDRTRLDLAGAAAAIAGASLWRRESRRASPY